MDAAYVLECTPLGGPEVTHVKFCQLSMSSKAGSFLACHLLYRLRETNQILFYRKNNPEVTLHWIVLTIPMIYKQVEWYFLIVFSITQNLNGRGKSFPGAYIVGGMQGNFQLLKMLLTDDETCQDGVPVCHFWPSEWNAEHRLCPSFYTLHRANFFMIVFVMLFITGILK